MSSTSASATVADTPPTASQGAEGLRPEPDAPARGIALGLVIGAALWAVLILLGWAAFF